ncbi:MAG: OadG family protein [Pseudomonadota bacterium]|nr:OadG family protein [Pseudomonadota bacterium]
MKDQLSLMESGVNLLINGMSVVFFFLLILILSTYLLKIIISPSLRIATNVIDVKNSFDKEENLNHKKIIKDVIENIRS